MSENRGSMSYCLLYSFVTELYTAGMGEAKPEHDTTALIRSATCLHEALPQRRQVHGETSPWLHLNQKSNLFRHRLLHDDSVDLVLLWYVGVSQKQRTASGRQKYNTITTSYDSTFPGHVLRYSVLLDPMLSLNFHPLALRHACMYVLLFISVGAPWSESTLLIVAVLLLLLLFGSVGEDRREMIAESPSTLSDKQ